MLPGMVAASIAVLERGSRFVEVGKRDIWSPQRAAQERPDLAYHLIAIDFWTPDVVGANMRRLAAMLHSGARTSVLYIFKHYYNLKSCQHYTLFLPRGKVHLQTSCSKGCQNPAPCWTRQIQARPHQPWSRCSVRQPGPHYYIPIHI